MIKLKSIWDIPNVGEVAAAINEAQDDRCWKPVAITLGTLTHEVRSVSNFKELQLNEDLLKGFACSNIISPYKIQKYLFPYTFENKKYNILIHAQNRSGKTVAAIITILARITKFSSSQFIIICPTCDSAEEVFDTIEAMTKFCPKITVRLAIRGIELKKFQKINETIIVGTPEKIYEYIFRDNLILENIELLVLDEVEAIIPARGHQNKVLPICKKLLPQSQLILMRSLTPNPETNEFVKKISDYAPLIMEFPIVYSGSQICKQVFVKCKSYDEKLLLLNKLADNAGEQILIICNTKEDSSSMTEHLLKRGTNVGLLYGKLKLEKRKDVKDCFKNNLTKILVTTPAFVKEISSENLKILVHCDTILTQDKVKLDHNTYRERKLLLCNSHRSYMINVLDSRWAEYAADENGNKISVLSLSELKLCDDYM